MMVFLFMNATLAAILVCVVFIYGEMRAIRRAQSEDASRKRSE